MARLVAEKLRKGYVESSSLQLGSTSTPSAEAGPDEDTWTVPSAWWRTTEPFRGRGPKRSSEPDWGAIAALAMLRVEYRVPITSALDHADSDPEMADHARRFLTAAEGETPGDAVHPLGRRLRCRCWW